MKFSKLTLLFGVGIILAGCGNDITKNQTALFWHNAIYKDVTMHNYDKADDEFTSLELEHPNSQFIPTDLLVLAKAHLYNEEYELANFYIDEYEKRYANRYETEWCEYMKSKIQFFSFQNAYTNQKKLYNTLAFVKSVINKYPDSIYIYELNTIKAKLEASKIVFNNNIASLYKRIDKPKAAKYYEINTTQPIIPPKLPWYKELFNW